MTLLAIDPGSENSAFVSLNDEGISSFGIWPNSKIAGWKRAKYSAPGAHLAIEMVASYGMPVGAEVFATCVWIGRFIQAWDGPFTLIYRKQITSHLCGSGKAKDANVRRALIDRFGPGKVIAIGTKKAPGPLYGVHADVWSALAVAVTFIEQKRKEGP